MRQPQRRRDLPSPARCYIIYSMPRHSTYEENPPKPA